MGPELRSDLVQRNHRVGDSKDEVDVVLGHLLCDQSQRRVILCGQSQMLWSGHANINTEMFLFIVQKSCIFTYTVLLILLPTDAVHPHQTHRTHTHHGGGHAVHVVRVQVALPVVRLHDPGQTTVQSHVGFSVGGEDQKVGSTGAPTDLRLLPIGPGDSEGGDEFGKKEGRSVCVSAACLCTLHTAAWMMASKPPSGASLFLDTICFFTSSVKRLTSSVRVNTCL